MSELRPLREKQKLVYHSSARFRVLAAGRRFGKTYLALAELLNAACSGPGKVVWYIAPTYKQARELAWSPIKTLTRPFCDQRPRETNLTIYLNNGSRISLHGADRPDTLRGSGVDFVVLDECASLKESLWREVIRPALADRNGSALFISTPKGVNHFFEYFEHAQTTDDWEAFHFTTLEGGNVQPEEITAAAADLDENSFRQEFEASFNASSQDRAYYAFNRELHVKPCQHNPIHPIVWSLDFNVAPFCAIVAQKIGEEVYVLQELITRDSGATVAACDQFERYNRTLKMYGPRTVHVYGDASGHHRSTSAESTDWYLIREFFSRHRGTLDPNFHLTSSNPAVRDRVNCVNARLQNALGDIRLFIDPSCKELIKDLERVSWSNGQLDKSDRARTHLSDALGYFLHQAFPLRLTCGPRSDGRII